MQAAHKRAAGAVCRLGLVHRNGQHAVLAGARCCASNLLCSSTASPLIPHPAACKHCCCNSCSAPAANLIPHPYTLQASLQLLLSICCSPDPTSLHAASIIAALVSLCCFIDHTSLHPARIVAQPLTTHPCTLQASLHFSSASPASLIPHPHRLQAGSQACPALA